jgi:transposase
LEHNERLNLIGTLCVTPARRKIKLHQQSHRRSIRGDEVVRFLSQLSHQVKTPIVMVWDRHPIHRRRIVKEWLKHHPRVQVYEFPTSAPELNPAEYVWTQISEYTAGTAPHNGAELRANVFAGIARTRRSQARLWACIFGSGLPWAPHRE